MLPEEKYVQLEPKIMANDGFRSSNIGQARGNGRSTISNLSKLLKADVSPPYETNFTIVLTELLELPCLTSGLKAHLRPEPVSSFGTSSAQPLIRVHILVSNQFDHSYCIASAKR